MNSPIAVCISDIHFSVKNLELASEALSASILKAIELQVPLIIAGDLNDTKAIIRAEVANRLIEILSLAKTPVYILVGNHDLINEKGHEHSLNFLRPYATIIDKPSFITRGNSSITMVPYLSNSVFLQESKWYFNTIIIMHQGVKGAWMGDYIQDKTSIDRTFNVPVISGHYHRHQTVGSVTYIGSPYTMSFGEANDGPKGFLILNSDGTYIRQILNLRKHVVIETHVDDLTRPIQNLNKDDLLWIKISGTSGELKKINKDELREQLKIPCSFKLDLIPTDDGRSELKDDESKQLTNAEIFDNVIDTTNLTEENKTRLKNLWKGIL